MAKKSANTVKENKVVLDGGVSYERQIYLVQPRLFSLIHSDTVMYERPLENLSFIEEDANDLRGLNKFLHIHVKEEDVVADNI